mmetsp:Transcript_120040/g.233776  ORF Transcript_120040/g.233776 Transcript_120040/m.233776 type:complete len:94 (+) Transcript_120040:102-383(+)
MSMQRQAQDHPRLPANSDDRHNEGGGGNNEVGIAAAAFGEYLIDTLIEATLLVEPMPDVVVLREILQQVLSEARELTRDRAPVGLLEVNAHLW